MLHKTRGIVFKYFKYRDTSIITKIYTEEFGMQTYIVNGVRSAKSRGKIALYQPLTLLDLVVYKKPTVDINRISELKCSNPLQSIPYEIVKSSIGVFLAEVLYKSVKEDESSPVLFEFIYHSIEVLDTLEKHYQNFHLQFLIKLSHHLGFGLIDMNNMPHLSGENLSQLFQVLINAKYGEALNITHEERKLILEDIITFYKVHIDSLKEIKSLKVLQAVFD